MDDALYHIFEYLEPHTLLNCCSVSRQWRSIAMYDGFWMRLCQRDYTYCHKIKKDTWYDTYKHCYGLNKLKTIVCTSDRLIKEWLSRATILYQPLDGIPEEIGYCPDPIMLNIANNNFSALPEEIGLLIKLTVLTIDKYKSGTVSFSVPDTISKLTNLYKLRIHNNQLSVFPPSLVELTNLEHLYLGYNNLTSVPADLSRLTNLRMLHLSHNKLVSIPKEIGRLTKLQQLFLSYNQLTSLPAELGLLANLETLNLNGNPISEFPQEIASLANLRTLRCNTLKEIPSILARMPNLEILNK